MFLQIKKVLQWPKNKWLDILDYLENLVLKTFRQESFYFIEMQCKSIMMGNWLISTKWIILLDKNLKIFEFR